MMGEQNLMREACYLALQDTKALFAWEGRAANGKDRLMPKKRPNSAPRPSQGF